jgi:hypothetical protein
VVLVEIAISAQSEIAETVLPLEAVVETISRSSRNSSKIRNSNILPVEAGVVKSNTSRGSSSSSRNRSTNRSNNSSSNRNVNSKIAASVVAAISA